MRILLAWMLTCLCAWGQMEMLTASSPLEYPGCVAWFCPEALTNVQNNTQITYWNDSSPSAVPLHRYEGVSQPRFTNYATDVFPGAYFNSSLSPTCYLITDSNTVFDFTNGTIMSVGQTPGATIVSISITNSDVNEHLLMPPASYCQNAFGIVEWWTHSGTTPDWAIHASLFGGGTNNFTNWINWGVSNVTYGRGGSIAPITNSLRRMKVGVRDSSGSPKAQGVLVELIVYNRRLTDEEMWGVTTYLRRKYRGYITGGI